MSKVYIKTNDNGLVIEINSDIFLNDTSGFILVDKGIGDRYDHAQTHYLEKPIIEERVYNYKFVNKKIEERTEAEKEADRALFDTPVSLEDRVSDIESAIVAIVYGGETV